MPITHTHEERAIAELLTRLQKAMPGPSNLSKDDLDKLGAAMTELATVLPDLAGRINGYAEMAGMVMACAKIKDGASGTWAQLTTAEAGKVARLIAARKTTR